MPIWSNCPPADKCGVSFTLRRTPQGRPLTCISTSEDLIGCPTHFYRGRTTPCSGEGCPACADGLPWRWHAYLSCLEISTREHFILELTAQAAENLISYRTAHKTIRGCLIELTRHKQRPNGRVILRCKPADLNKVPLPPAPDLIKCMQNIWNLASSHVREDGVARNQKRIRVTSPNGDEV